MHFWQRAMIFLATHKGVKQWVQDKPVTRGLASRFVGGKSEVSAVSRALDLKKAGLTVSFFFLGEYVRDPAVIAKTMTSLKETMALAVKSKLDLHVSIDPTQAGLMQSFKQCRTNFINLAKQVQILSRPGCRNLLMVDMEDSRVTDHTLDLFYDLTKQGLPMAVTLQACLFRTPEDLVRILETCCSVRLVKGAFAESPAISHSPGKKTDNAYLALASTMLDPRNMDKGLYPVFATHDHKMILRIVSLAQSRKIQPDQYEFEMLLGVRPELQHNLVKQGFQVRLYLPYGRDFWPYAVRRIGENPKNIKFLAATLFRSGL